MTRFLSPLAALVLAAGVASAQAPLNAAFAASPTVKGAQVQQLQQAYFARQAYAAQYSAAPPVATRAAATSAAAPIENLQVSVVIPPAAATPAGPASPVRETVAIRGPDGTVRNFAVEGGRETLASRVIVVHPGESATIQLAIAPRK